jgi:hypothetical protein
MTINGVQVITEAGGTAGLTVEFVDDLGTIVSVRFSGKDGGVNRTNAVQQAKAICSTSSKVTQFPMR